MHWHVMVTRIVDDGSEYIVHNIICHSLDRMIARYQEAVAMYCGDGDQIVQERSDGCDIVTAKGDVYLVHAIGTCEEEGE